MSLNSLLEMVLKKIKISDSDCAQYNAVVNAINNQLMEDVKESDSHFRDAFAGLSLTGNYLDKNRLLHSKMHINLKLPIKVKPQPAKDRNGFVYLEATGGLSHPAVVDGYVNPIALRLWLRKVFKDAFESSHKCITIDNVRYDLKYATQEHKYALTVVARSELRHISLDFLPAFEFNYVFWPLKAPSVRKDIKRSWHWCAIPQYNTSANERAFMVCAPHWEREMMKDTDNAKNVLRLMKAIRDIDREGLFNLSDEMLKCLILLRIESCNWQRDLLSLLYTVLNGLCESLIIHRLPFYLAHGYNHFDSLSKEQITKCKSTLRLLLNKLYKLEKKPNLNDLEKLFVNEIKYT